MRLANEPLTNHWWNSTLYETAKGLTTSLVSHPTGPAFQIDFDFVDHQLLVMALQPICSAQPFSSNSSSIARREFSSSNASGIGMVRRSVSS